MEGFFVLGICKLLDRVYVLRISRQIHVLIKQLRGVVKKMPSKLANRVGCVAHRDFLKQACLRDMVGLALQKAGERLDPLFAQFSRHLAQPFARAKVNSRQFVGGVNNKFELFDNSLNLGGEPEADR